MSLVRAIRNVCGFNVHHDNSILFTVFLLVNIFSDQRFRNNDTQFENIISLLGVYLNVFDHLAGW